MRKAVKKLFILLPPAAFCPVLSSCVQEGEDLGKLLSNAAFNTLIGMGMVFVVLIIICFIIYLFTFIHRAEEKAAKKALEAKEEPKEEPRETPGEPECIQEPAPELKDDTELVAVIAAAIAAYEGTSADGIIVRSIRRVRERKQETARG